MRVLVISLVLLTSGTLPGVAQQDAAPSEPTTAACSFDDGKEMSVRYSKAPDRRGEEMHDGKLWEAGGSPMLLFTQTGLTLGHADLPAGAYSMYVIPKRKSWTLVVSSNVSGGGKYDEKQDLVRESMELGELSHTAEQPEVAFGKIGPKQCSMNVYYGKQGAWTTFEEK
jgi:hypothetical protein